MSNFVIYVNNKCDGRLGRKGSITGVCCGRGLDLASLFVRNGKKKEKRKETTTLIYFTFISVRFSE